MQGFLFYIHRGLSLLLIVGHLFICYRLWPILLCSPLGYLLWGLTGIYCLEISCGALLYYFDLPAAVQPIHLLLACIAFALQFNLLQSTASAVASKT